MPTFESKELRGINLRQLISYTVAVISVSVVYIDLRNNTLRNREIVEEFKEELKEMRRVDDIRLREIESLQRITDIRLTVIETQLKINN